VEGTPDVSNARVDELGLSFWSYPDDCRGKDTEPVSYLHWSWQRSSLRVFCFLLSLPKDVESDKANRSSLQSYREISKMTKKEKDRAEFDLGLGGIFKGIGSFLDLVEEMEKKGATEVRKEGELGKEFKAVYGFSVRFAGEGKPTVEAFGNVREDKERGPVVDEVREPIVDVFDEGDTVMIVAELPGVDEKDIRFEIRDDIVTLSAGAGEKKYYKEILLSLQQSGIDEKKTSSSYRNGIFELKLWKK
jgi:HSP20 family protein